MRRLSWSLTFCLAYTGPLGAVLEIYPAAAQPLQTAIEWKGHGPDLEVARASVESGSFFPSQVVFVRSALKRYRIGIIRAAELGRQRAAIKGLCTAAKAAACINANFFDHDGNPLGLIISGGVTHQKMHRGGNTLTGIFQASREEVSIVGRFEFRPETILEAVQAGPRLLLEQVAVHVARDSVRTRRSGVCIDRMKRVLFFTVDSEFMGLSIEQLQWLLRQDGVDCVNALNLDGGGSAQLFVSGEEIFPEQEKAEEIFVRGRDEIPVALALFANS